MKRFLAATLTAVNALAGWNFTGGPYNLTTLPSLEANTQELQTAFTDSLSKQHLLLYYYYSDLTTLATNKFQILDVNTTDGTWRVVDAIVGRPASFCTVYNTPAAKIYHASLSGTGFPAKFMEYNPTNGVVREIGSLNGTVSAYVDNGDDGNVYIGQYSGNYVAQYNPSSDTLTNLGQMDAASAADCPYAYSLGCDGSYLYVTLGKGRWELATMKLSDNTIAITFNTDDKAQFIYKGTAGGWYFWRQDSSNAIHWYTLSGGTATPYGGTPSVWYYHEHGNVVDALPDIKVFANLDVNLDFAYPDSAATNAVVQYRVTGASNYNSVTATGVRIAPVQLKRLYAWDSTNFLGWGPLYGSVFHYSRPAQSYSALGRSSSSFYDMTRLGADAYFACYSDINFRYDTTAAWTLKIGSPDQTVTNPRSLTGCDFGHYSYYCTTGSDNWVYFGGFHVRESSGGELGWYDPVGNVCSSDRTDFQYDDPIDLVSIAGGTKMAFSGRQRYFSGTGVSSNLFIFNVASKTLEATYQPLGTKSPGKLMECNSGLLLGASGTNLYLFNPSTGSTVLSNNLSAACFGALNDFDWRLAKGPDGNAYLSIGNALYRVSSTDLTQTKVVDLTSAQNPVFSGGDIYLYATSSLSVVTNVLFYTPPNRISSARLSGARL